MGIVEQRERIGAHEAARDPQLFRIDWRPCRFGGRRPYVECSRCGRTVLHLYAHREWLACRRCAGLRYACQSEKSGDRARRAARKVRAKLGAGVNLTIPVTCFPKPKHMKERTWLRLREKAQRYEHVSLGQMAAFLDRLRGAQVSETRGRE